MQLQTPDGGVQGVELPAFLSGSPGPVRARRPGLGFEVPVEVVAALHFSQTAGEGVMQRLGHGGDGPVHREGWRTDSFGLALLRLICAVRRQEKGQPPETFRALPHPQLEEHLWPKEAGGGGGGVSPSSFLQKDSRTRL